MVLKVQRKTAPISNGNYVPGAKSSIGSPTFCRDGKDEKSVSKASLPPLSDICASPYSNSKSSFSKKSTVKRDIFSVKSKKKSVRFKMDPCDSRKHHCLIYTTNMVLTSIDRKIQWYSSAEIKRMRAETHSEALSARSSAFQYLQLFQQLRAICEDTDSELNKQRYLAHIVASSQYRGLESFIFVETVRLQQRQTLQEILAAQEDFRDLLSSDELILELQTLSIKLSHCSARLAYILGVGDNDEAKHVATPEHTRSTDILNEQDNECFIQSKGEGPKSSGVSIDSSVYEI